MTAPRHPEPISYAAQITNVREVALHGAADADYWRAALQPYRLWPHAAAGAAQLAIGATALTWGGLAFRELIVTLPVCTAPDRPQPDGFFLAFAFNSARLLAWAERALFQTPYEHQAVSLDTGAPALALLQRGRPLVRAQMATPHPRPTTGAAAGRSLVFLPSRSPQRGRRHFFAAISGAQTIYPFTPGADRVEIAPPADHPIARALSESRFTAQEWRISTDATHARSRTYRSSGG